jgi:hypothetical protein
VRIKRPDTAFGTPVGKATRPVKNKSYISWLHDLPCCVCGDAWVDAAHLSMAKPEYGHWGRGKGRKASDRWALPLCRDCHTKQHDIGEGRFWEDRDPWLLCLILFGIYSDIGEDATEMATELILNRELG